MIDLHLHTTASDGLCTPRELVERAAAAMLSVMAVADHDTVAACGEVASLASARGIETVTGIEITAVENERDIHMLGYFVDAEDAALGRFLVSQRAIRVERVGRIATRLAELGMPVSLPDLPRASANNRRSLGRPMLADAMIAAGYVADRREAFERWLGAGCPAFVSRTGASPAAVVEIVHGAGGIASLAHPARTRLSDERIARMAAAGLDAIEVYHSDHDERDVEHYAALAEHLGVLRTGGSDFHGDPGHGLEPGTAHLPAEYWEALRASVKRP